MNEYACELNKTSFLAFLFFIHRDSIWKLFFFLFILERDAHRVVQD